MLCIVARRLFLMTPCRDVISSGRSETPFDVIDLDPYGTAAPFLHPAVMSVKDGGGVTMGKVEGVHGRV